MKMTNLKQAARVYKTRQRFPPFSVGIAIRMPITIPRKYRGPIWYPKPFEVRDCCRKVKEPTSMFPHNYLNHVKTLTHIAKKFNVDRLKLKDEIRVKKCKDLLEQMVLRMRLKKKRK